MKNGQTILGSRYTDEIKNNSATSSKMFNLSKKLENDSLREIHKSVVRFVNSWLRHQQHA